MSIPTPDDSGLTAELEQQKKQQATAQDKLEQQQLMLLRSRLSGGSVANVWDTPSSQQNTLG